MDEQRRTWRSTDEDDELIQYMSNLPSYIEEKVFGIGVLDWESFEKWQHDHKGDSTQN